jgi:hypothetical protein
MFRSPQVGKPLLARRTSDRILQRRPVRGRRSERAVARWVMPRFALCA